MGQRQPLKNQKVKTAFFIFSLFVVLGFMLSLTGICDTDFRLSIDSEPQISCVFDPLEFLAAIPAMLAFYLTVFLTSLAGAIGLAIGIALSLLGLLACTLFCLGFIFQILFMANGEKNEEKSCTDESVALFLKQRPHNDDEGEQ